jgi:signal transduction histidine kinase
VQGEVEPPTLELHADEQRLHQVLANLVANAVRHSPRGGRVLVRAVADDGLARLEVRDDGPGIPPEEAERVFERFYRSDHARSAKDGGSGLGLSIARWIVDLHGGRIRAEAAEPHGCRMVVELER